MDAVRAEQGLEVSSECVEWSCHIYDFSLCLSGNYKKGPVISLVPSGNDADVTSQPSDDIFLLPFGHPTAKIRKISVR